MENTESQSFEYASGGLSEDEVKRRFVPFLKDFYKHRYEPAADSLSVSLDNVSEGGLVADVVMTFKKKEGSPFTCACEATSRDKIGEVKFSLNFVYFRWDAAAFGAFFSAVAYSFFYNTQFQWLLHLSLEGNLGLVIGTFIIGFFLWYFTMQGWRKYRYIYAVEQFKKYRADEQWIALAEDVFLAANDPYLAELKNQCIYNGFGLALVPQEGAVRVLNSPSRLGVFGEDRNMTHWLTRSEWYQKMTQTMPSMNRLTPPAVAQASWNKIKSWVKYLVIEPFNKHLGDAVGKPIGQSKNIYTRFMSGQTVQKWVTLLCLLVLVPMFHKVLTYSEENIADLEKLQNWHGGQNPEDQQGVVFDGAPIPFDGKPRGVPKQYPVSKNTPTQEEDIPTINLSGIEEEEPEYAGKPAKTAKPVPKSQPVPQPQPASAPPASDPCAKLGGKKGWVVQESAYTIQDSAASRASSLRNQGVSAQSGPRSCFEAGGEGFIVWLGSVYATETAARNALADFEKTMQEKALLKGKLIVRKI